MFVWRVCAEVISKANDCMSISFEFIEPLFVCVPAEPSGPAKVVRAGNPPKARRGGKVSFSVCVSAEEPHRSSSTITTTSFVSFVVAAMLLDFIERSLFTNKCNKRSFVTLKQSQYWIVPPAECKRL